MQLGVCYYPEQWPASMWRDDARRMAELGIRVVRIGEFAWSRMEPEPGRHDWGWLDDAIGILAAAGLQVVLGTPTAAPPRWLVERHPEILPVDADGHAKGFGSRRHYCFSSAVFQEHCRRIVRALGERYGRHPAVVAWQIDNEYGCHGTITSYSPAALQRFRQSLAARYGSIEALNAAWGNVFWSMEYTSFEQIGFPVHLAAPVNPVHALDFRRFASEEVARFHRLQVELLHELAPGKPLLHNFMAFSADFDHHALAPDLDIAAWDSYPLGFVESTHFLDEEERQAWMRTGHPDIAAFHHDLYRGLGRGRLWVVEQQAGPVNWAPWNPVPLPGMVRAWTWEAFAHGAELVAYFRWRQLPLAQEQMHSGLHTPDDRLDDGGREAMQVAGEMARVPADPMRQAPVALLYDYPSHWMTAIQPHAAGHDYQGEAFAWYGALRQLGLDVDVLGPEADLAGYALVLVPGQVIVEPHQAERLRASGGQLVVGPRSGSKTRDFAIPARLPPGPLASLLPMRVTRIDSLRPGATVAVHDGGGRELGRARRWREIVDADASVGVEARFVDGTPAVLRHHQARYLAGSFDAGLLRSTLRRAAHDAGLATLELPPGLRLSRRGTLRFAIHFGPGDAEVPAPADARFLLGQRRLAAGGVAAWQEA